MENQQQPIQQQYQQVQQPQNVTNKTTVTIGLATFIGSIISAVIVVLGLVSTIYFSFIKPDIEEMKTSVGKYIESDSEGDKEMLNLYMQMNGKIENIQGSMNVLLDNKGNGRRAVDSN
jgi:hypothetical protein